MPLFRDHRMRLDPSPPNHSHTHKTVAGTAAPNNDDISPQSGNGYTPQTAQWSIPLTGKPETEFTYVYRNLNLGYWIRTTAADARMWSMLGYEVLDGYTYNAVREWAQPLPFTKLANKEAFGDQEMQVEAAEDDVFRCLNEQYEFDEEEGSSGST